MFKPIRTHIRLMIICCGLLSIGYLYSNSYDIFNDASSQTLDKITIDIHESQFIPITDTTNNLDVLVNYTTNDLSLSGSQINAVMEVFAPNGTQIKTLLFTDGFQIYESGNIFMSTKFTDDSLSSLDINVTLTDLAKTMTISNIDTATVPFDEEEGQERLRDKFFAVVEEDIQRQNGENSDREIERIEPTSQPDLEITGASTYFTDDYFHIVGEVLNKDSEDKEFVEVIATFYDEENNVIGTENTFTNPSTISSQEYAPFEFMIGENDV